MDVANAVAVILGGILAISGLILARKPEAKSLIDKLSPYQAAIGVAMIALGIVNLVRFLPYLTASFKVPVVAASVLAMLGVSIVLGALFGMPQIAKWIPGESPAEQKALELSQKVAPYQIVLGLVGLVSSLIYLLYRFGVIHVHA